VRILRRERGAAAVEMAILLPFLLVLFTGITDVGWLIWKRIELQEAIQEGAIYFAYNPGGTARENEAITRTRAATNAPLKVSDFSASRPFCPTTGSKTFSLGVAHEVRLPVSGMNTVINVTVSGDVLKTGGCQS
jgi:hypothetical protein